MHEAAYVLAAFALGSQLLALVRDHLLASSFGASHTLDLYYAAFRIPDFLFATIASLLSLYALLPVLSKLERESEAVMVGFLRQTLLLFFVGMGAISLIVFICAPLIIPLVIPGIANPDLVLLVRILLLQPIFLGASNILAALTQLRHRFLLYAISPLLYNIGIIFGIVALYPRMGLAGLGWGVVLGAALHMLLQVPFFAAEESKRLPLRQTIHDFFAVLMLSVPRTLALGATQITSLVLVGIASYLATGSIAVFTFAYNLQAVPLAIIGVSYSVAAFPTLARLHAQGEFEKFSRYIDTALRHIFFWAIPATIFIIVLRAQLVRVILGAGLFDWAATRLTAAALALFILSLAAQSVTLLIARGYYAAGSTKKPLYWGVVDVVVSVVSALLLLRIFYASPFIEHFIESMLRVSDIAGTAVVMLALGYALGSIAEFCIGYWFFVRDFKLERVQLSRLVFQSFAASVIGGAVTYAILALTGAAGEVNTTLGLVLQGTTAGVAGLLVTALTLALLKNQELYEALATINHKFKRSSVTALEATDVSS
ncbi:MAG: putative peptidoglycan lipid flippase [Patescibacteria group bacterium]|nr:putative peptidoglycan lipid flippase [Patescibacteria group bacterium]